MSIVDQEVLIDLGAGMDAARATFLHLLEQPLADEHALSANVDLYLEVVRHLAATSEAIDVESAERLAGACHELLASVGPQTPEPVRRLIQAAVRYFLEEEDADEDLASRSGFDDDVQVVNAVTRYLGRDDLRI